MKYKAIIFDWDGTLAKTLHLWLAGYREALTKQEHTFLDSIIAHEFFYNLHEAIEKYPTIDFDQLLVDAREHVYSNLETVSLYDGVRETLTTLGERGVKIGLVSSSRRRLLEKGLTQHTLTSSFSSVIAGDDVTRVKPHPESFLTTMEYLNVVPEETLIVGDSKTDIEAGKHAYTDTCLFFPKDNEPFFPSNEVEDAQATYVLENIPEIITLL